MRRRSSSASPQSANRTGRSLDSFRRGTASSNPSSSSAESAANFVFGREAWKGPRRRQGTRRAAGGGEDEVITCGGDDLPRLLDLPRSRKKNRNDQRAGSADFQNSTNHAGSYDNVSDVVTLVCQIAGVRRDSGFVADLFLSSFRGLPQRRGFRLKYSLSSARRS
jgi:hypothetical protein